MSDLLIQFAEQWIPIQWIEGFDPDGFKVRPRSVHNLVRKIDTQSLIIAAEMCFSELAQRAYCPSCQCGGSLLNIIMDLNDEHGWSFTEIADWLETLET